MIVNKIRVDYVDSNGARDYEILEIAPGLLVEISVCAEIRHHLGVYYKMQGDDALTYEQIVAADSLISVTAYYHEGVG